MLNLLFGLALLASGPANAHPAHHSPKPAVHAQVKIHWSWTAGHRAHGKWIKGHWTKRSGPHPYAHHPNWRWVAGHYERRGACQRWVPGHWQRRR